MNDEIKHDGTILSIANEHVKVRILQTSACLHCKIAGHCNSADSKEKIVDIWTKRASQYSVGQDVVVVMSGKLGLKAVLLAFVVPVILASLLMWGTMQLVQPDGVYPLTEPYDQGVAAVVGILTFVVYYTCLYFFRDVLQEKFQFRLLN